MSGHHSHQERAVGALKPRAFWYIRMGLTLAVLTAVAAASARAQESAPITRLTLRPVVGAVLPTGPQHALLKEAVLVGAQASFGINQYFAARGSFSWSPSKDKTEFQEHNLDFYQYDIGLEGLLPNLTSRSAFTTRPYAAIGVGGRTYDYRDRADLDAETNFVGYGALGLDVSPNGRRVGLRLEARDNVSAFKGLRGELPERKARNDVQVTAGLTVKL
jgi:hypothetical protein